MKVSIVTITYNSSKTIVDTIKSVISQTYKDVEFIIIDGASTDDTLTKINLYSSSINVLISEPDKGIYDAMNKGLSKASGEIVAILNSDDVYSHSFVLEKIVNEFKATNCDGVYADLHYVDSIDTRKIVRRWKSGVYRGNSFLYGWMPPHPSFFVKRNVYEKYGKFNTILKSAADYELMLRFIHKYKIKISYLPEVLVNMRIGGASNGSLKNRIKANLEDRKAWELNGIKPYFFTLILKPLRKLTQFF
jgi:glycosyltransferase involved in cell wall biosynthesis